jgi:hypothetical protein
VWALLAEVVDVVAEDVLELAAGKDQDPLEARRGTPTPAERSEMRAGCALVVLFRQHGTDQGGRSRAGRSRAAVSRLSCRFDTDC